MEVVYRVTSSLPYAGLEDWSFFVICDGADGHTVCDELLSKIITIDVVKLLVDYKSTPELEYLVVMDAIQKGFENMSPHLKETSVSACLVTNLYQYMVTCNSCAIDFDSDRLYSGDSLKVECLFRNIDHFIVLCSSNCETIERNYQRKRYKKYGIQFIFTRWLQSFRLLFE